VSNSKAVVMIKHAVDDGFLPNPKKLICVDCGDKATEYDHRNYDYPLSVEAVCHKCNCKRGKALGTHDEKDPSIYAFALRLPSELKTQLEDIAAAENRSLNGQIVQILQDTVEAYKFINKNDRRVK